MVGTCLKLALMVPTLMLSKLLSGGSAWPLTPVSPTNSGILHAKSLLILEFAMILLLAQKVSLSSRTNATPKVVALLMITLLVSSTILELKLIMAVSVNGVYAMVGT